MTNTPRGTCRGCGRPIVLLIDGRIRKHGHYVDGRRLAGDCAGSYQAPASTDQNQENGS